MLVITHYQRLLNYIVPDKVHVMAGGMIQKSGGKDLALELEKTGYAEFKSKALDTGDKFSFTFTAPGTWGYFCSIHPHMTGKVIVKPAS